MSDVTGPISSLPGASHAVPEGQACDTHPDRPATHRVQGETDSFGSELHDMCNECHERYKQDMADSAEARSTGKCEWCGTQSTDLRPRRDWEEGSSGRVYDVCGACVKAENDRLSAELAESDDYDWN